MSTCPVCLESIEEKDKIKTHCGHTFHKECILLWYRNKRNCPLCRTSISFEMVFECDYSCIFTWTYKKYKRLSKVIDGNFFGNVEKKLKYGYLHPIYEMATTPGNVSPNVPLPEDFKNFDIILGLYRVEDPKNQYSFIDITLYTRLVILFNKKENISLIEKKSFNEYIYYESKEESEFLSKNKFIILFQWIEEILYILEKYRDFNYSFNSEDYSVIFDLMITTLKHYKIDLSKEKNLIQGFAVVSMLCVLNFKNANLKFKDLNYWTTNLYSEKDFQKYIDFGKEYMESNLRLI